MPRAWPRRVSGVPPAGPRSPSCLRRASVFSVGGPVCLRCVPVVLPTFLRVSGSPACLLLQQFFWDSGVPSTCLRCASGVPSASLRRCLRRDSGFPPACPVLPGVPPAIPSWGKSGSPPACLRLSRAYQCFLCAFGVSPACFRRVRSARLRRVLVCLWRASGVLVTFLSGDIDVPPACLRHFPRDCGVPPAYHRRASSVS